MRILLAILLSYTSLTWASNNQDVFPSSTSSVYKIESKSKGVRDCSDQLRLHLQNTYCLQYNYDKKTKDIYIDVYVIIKKGHANGLFDTKEQINTAYTNFELWPSYIQRSSEIEGILNFPLSKKVVDRSLEGGYRQLVHEYRYTSKAPIIGSLDIKSTSTYTIQSIPVSGSVASAKFKSTVAWGRGWELITPLSDGSSGKGIRGHEGSIYLIQLKEEIEGFLVVLDVSYLGRSATTMMAD